MTMRSRLLRPRSRRATVALLATLLAAGCATTPAARGDTPQTTATGQAADALAQRRAWMASATQWSFAGRAAIRRGRDGGSGRLEWTQRDRDRYEVALSAPVTRQSWRLSGDLATGSARLDGLDGGVREGADAEALLSDATGWQVPVRQLASWVRGAPLAEVAVSALAYDAAGRPAGFEQAGWTVRYLEWRPGPPGQPDLPARIEASSADARVRLAIDEWTFASP